MDAGNLQGWLAGEGSEDTRLHHHGQARTCWLLTMPQIAPVRFLPTQIPREVSELCLGLQHLTSHSGGSHPLRIGCVTNPDDPLLM